MQCKIFILLFQFVILGNKYHFINAKAIVGSDKIKQIPPNEYTSVACLLMNVPENSIEKNTFCTAVFISNVHLLTSAHCLDFVGEIGFVVNAGSHDIRLGHMYYPLWWLTYEKYLSIYNLTPKHKKNDIGIIRLPQGVPNIIPVLLSTASPPSQIFGKTLIVVGCGLSNTGSYPIIKETGPVDIISNNDCARKLAQQRGFPKPIEENLVCSYSKPLVLLALGDFGGPLLLDGELVGINIGLAPKEGVPDTKKKNLHILINEYKEFIGHNLIL